MSPAMPLIERRIRRIQHRVDCLYARLHWAMQPRSATLEKHQRLYERMNRLLGRPIRPRRTYLFLKLNKIDPRLVELSPDVSEESNV